MVLCYVAIGQKEEKFKVLQTITFQETPTSDFGSNGSFEPSEPSTPGTPIEPFQPGFKVKVTEPVKDGEVVMYTIKTVKVCNVAIVIIVLSVIRYCMCI